MDPRADGFSLVEVVVATMLLTIVLLGMAGSTMYLSAQLRASTLDAQRTQARTLVVERLRGGPFESLASSDAPLGAGQFSATWSVSSPTPRSKRVTLVTSGPAVRGKGNVTVADTMQFDVLKP